MIDLVIDNIIFSLQKSGGISVVWYEMLKRLLNEKDINISFVEANNNNPNHYRAKLDIIHCDIILNQNIRFVQRYFNPRIKKNTPFIFHSTYYRTSHHKLALNITTVHDFTYEYFSHGIKKYVHSYQKFDAIRKSKYIICVSENTKKDLLNFLPEVNSEKIVVIPNGVSNDYFLLDDDDFHYEGYKFKKNSYVLFVGSRAKYKNFDVVIDTIAKTNFSLIVVGHPFTTFENKLIKERNVGNKIHLLGNVSNKILNSLYNHAFALIYPSSYEGFRIPVLEAQRAGCPVIAFNKSSIPEVIGDKTILINQLNETSILNKLEVLKDKDIRKKIINNGLVNSSRFSWNNTYNQLLNLYKVVWEESF